MTDFEKLSIWLHEKDNCVFCDDESCCNCPYENTRHCTSEVRKAIESLVDMRLPRDPVRGEDDNYYCGKCGVKITNAIKIYDGEKYITSHPDHLKPVNKWTYCKNCGKAINWE